MAKIYIRLYEQKDFGLWNNFISEAKNSTFLFHRDFMEYHKDRFQDFSLLIFKNDKLIAVLPANLDGKSVYSHQGLTYGGFITKKEMRTTLFFEIFKETLKFLQSQNIENLYLKEIPYFYNSFPNDEWKYLAFCCKAELYRRDLCSVIHLKSKNKPAKKFFNNLKKYEKNDFFYKETELWEDFWNQILIPVLKENHQASPVHSLEEILNLKNKFPENIKLFCVFLNGEIIGGTVIFIHNKVAHCQYIAIKNDYRNTGALHFLFYHLITEDFKNFDFFDFGISNEENGTKTNKGLLFWKESFGAAGVSQDFYKFSTSIYPLIDEMYL